MLLFVYPESLVSMTMSESKLSLNQLSILLRPLIMMYGGIDSPTAETVSIIVFNLRFSGLLKKSLRVNIFSNFCFFKYRLTCSISIGIHTSTPEGQAVQKPDSSKFQIS